MNQDLLNQLSDYGTFCDERQGVVSADDVTVAVTPLRASTGSTRTRNNWLIAAAAAALVFVMAGGVALVGSFNGDADAPAGEPAATTTISPTTTLSAAPVQAEEPATTTISPTTEPASKAVTVGWASVLWDEGQGPWTHTIVATSNGFLGTDRDGALWRSETGSTWDRTLAEISGVAIASNGSSVLASGLRDGRRVLLRTTNGNEWTEIDRSLVPTRQGRNILTTTPSGLTWFGPDASSGRGGGVLAHVNGDVVTDAYEPPWAEWPCCVVTALVQVGDNIAAYQYDRNQPPFSHAWEYLGEGEWTDASDMTQSHEHAVVGDTVLMFDQTNGTCCGRPIAGTSLWPLLASGNGIDWTEIGQVAGDEVHMLRVLAGRSFWIYGPDIGGGGNEMEVGPETVLGYSTDGTNWQEIYMPEAALGFVYIEPVTGFVHIAGETIFIYANNNPGQKWIGTIQTE